MVMMKNVVLQLDKACRKILAEKLPNYHEYLELPEYKQLIALLEKGIAYHHGGMMQILKEDG